MMRHRLLPFLAALLLSAALSAQTTATDSVLTTVVSHLLPGHNTLLRPLPYYSCVHYDRAGLRFPGRRDAHDRFNARLDSLLLFHSGKVNIWHVGGSHVQADHFSHRLRTNFTEMQPENIGVRGVLFPFGMASTNWNHNYRITWTGNWNAGRNVQRGADASFDFGLSGIAATTTDTLASITLVLNIGQTPSWQFNRLRVLGYGPDDVQLYCVEQHAEGQADTLRATMDSLSMSRVIAFDALHDSTTVYIKTTAGGFTLTGLIPENDLHGISWYSSGINGASLPSWQRCRHLQRDLQLVHPDLVVFAIGINDANVPASEFNAETFKANYRQLIAQVEAVSPGCAYLFVTNNDTHRRISRKVRRPNANALAVQKAFGELAEEYGGAVWDVFDMMGGLGSSTAWRDAGLMTTDLIHFTRTGYELLGDMLYNALIDDYMTHH